MSEAVSDSSESEERVLLFLKIHVRDVLVAADIERTDDDSPAFHRLKGFLICFKLLLFGRQMRVVHEQEFRAEEAYALSVALHGLLCILRCTDVAENLEFISIGCKSLLADEFLQFSLLLDEVFTLDDVLRKHISFRIDEYIAGCTVYDSRILVLNEINDSRH